MKQVVRVDENNVIFYNDRSSGYSVSRGYYLGNTGLSGYSGYSGYIGLSRCSGISVSGIDYSRRSTNIDNIMNQITIPKEPSFIKKVLNLFK